MENLINERLNYFSKETIEFLDKEETLKTTKTMDEDDSFNSFFDDTVSTIMGEYETNKNKKIMDSSIMLEESFMINGKIHRIIIKKDKNNLEIKYNGKEYSSVDEIENEYIRKKVKNMLDKI